MKKLGLVATVSAMLAIAPSVLAHAPLSGTACRGTKVDRQISLHVHGLGCSTAYKAVRKAGKGYKCKTVGETTKLPVAEKCVSTKHKSVYYEYLVFGG
jgi:hypothetical protein